MAGSGNGTGGDTSSTGGSSTGGTSNGTGGDGGADGTGGSDNEGGPSTDWENPVEIEADEPFSADIPEDGEHFFSFTPATSTIYVLTLASEGNPHASFHIDSPEGGACAIGFGCCFAEGSSCSTDLYEGTFMMQEPLEAGTTYTVVVVGDFDADSSYTLTITEQE